MSDLNNDINCDGKFCKLLTEGKDPKTAFIEAYGGPPKYKQLLTVLCSDDIQNSLRNWLYIKRMPIKSFPYTI